MPGKKIRAHELKTYLKVGQTTSDQKDPTPFIIEWIPEILPFMKIGELRLSSSTAIRGMDSLNSEYLCLPR